MKQISILLSYVFNDYLNTCNLLEVPIACIIIIYLLPIPIVTKKN